MKRKKLITTMFFLLLIVLTIVSFVLVFLHESQKIIKNDLGNFGLYLLSIILPISATIVLIAELDIFFDVMYFISDKQRKRKVKTVLNIISFMLSCGIIATTFVFYFELNNISLLLLGVLFVARVAYIIFTIITKISNCIKNKA